MVQVEAGESFDLKLMMAKYGQADAPVDGAVILKNTGADASTETQSSFTTDANGVAHISFSTAGTYFLSAVRRDAATNGIDISRPYCKVIVDAKPISGGGDGGSSTITVSLSVKGNSAKGTILSSTNVTILEGESVFDALATALLANNISYNSRGDDGEQYIVSIAGLAEFADGPSSGWIYSVNGKKPNISIGAYIPKSKDIIKLEFTKGDTSTNGDSDDSVSVSADATTTQATQDILKVLKGKSELSNWEAFGLMLNGVEVPDQYWQQLEAMMKENEGDLSRITDYASMALVLRKAGKSTTDFSGYNILEKIYNNENLGKQGVNGYIFSLIELTNEKEIPTDAKWNIETIMSELLKYQNADGGFTLDFGQASSVDLTAMALSALAPYQNREEIMAVIEKAIAYLIKVQKADGTFGFGDEKTCESTAQVIIALSQLGIDAKDSQFIKNKNDLIDVLLSYQKTGGTFAHTKGGASDSMATEQALLALTAYNQSNENKGGIYYFDAKTIVDEFNDMGQVSDWARDFVQKAKAAGIISGNEKNEMQPQKELTRAEFVTMLLRAMKVAPTDAYQPLFDDVMETDWYSKYIAKAVELKLVQGVTQNSFDPEGLITREDIAVILARAYQLNAETITDQIVDMNSVSDYAKNAVTALYDARIMQGDQGQFEPKNPTSREMAVVVMVRLIDTNSKL